MAKRKLTTCALTLLLACLLLLNGCNAGGFTQKGDIIINEVVTKNVNSLAADDVVASGWVELYNNSDKSVDLEGYTLSKTDAQTMEFALPKIQMQPRGYLVLLACESTSFKEYVAMGFEFGGVEATLTLKNKNGVSLGKVKTNSLYSDMSYCKNEYGDYVFCSTPTPNAQNGGKFFATLDDYKNNRMDTLVLNEATRDWVELFNASDKEINMCEFYLTDETDEPMKSRLPDVVIGAGKYVTISLGQADESCDYQADFKIKSSENAVYLCLDKQILAVLYFMQNVSSISTGLNADGDTVNFLFPTKGASNDVGVVVNANDMGAMLPTEPVVVNELQIKNDTTLIDASGKRPSWIELVNNTDGEVDLSTYAVSDDPRKLDKWRFSLESRVVLKDKYALVFLSGDGMLGDKDEFHTSFKLSEGETLYFTDLSTMKTQAVDFADECRLSDISYGYKDGKWLYFGKATPKKDNTTQGFEGINDKQNLSTLDTSGVYISEACAAHAARANELDWIEIYNPTDNPVDLLKYFLSNDPDTPFMFKLSGTVYPHAYAVIYSTDDVTKQNERIAPFGISPTGERLLLADEDGCARDYFETGAQRLNTTSGRSEDDKSGARVFFTSPTKGKKNVQGMVSYTKPPVFSLMGGFYKDSVTVEITCASQEAKIYYTTDGTRPTQSSTLYTKPLRFDKNTPLKAVAFVDLRLQSDLQTATYIFEEKHTLPVVCISINKSDFEAVCSVTDKKMPIIERECVIEYYEPDGTLGTSFSAGLRISGNGTRKYPQKSLNIYLRGAYGKTSVVYPFFENYNVMRFKSLTLRNAGQNQGYSRMTDAFCSMLVKGMDINYAETRFSVLYVNGEYYGIYDLKENQNEDFYASRYGVDPNLVNSIRRNLFALSGSNVQIKEVYHMAQTMDMSVQSNYEKFIKYVDESAFADYIIARSYVGDTDLFNQKYCNSNDYKMRWCPIFFDLDYGFSFTGNVDTLGKYFSGVGIQSPDGSLSNMYIPTALLKNKGWKEHFIERYAECLKTQFAQADELFESMVGELEPEMPRHIARWKLPNSVETWQKYVQNMRRSIDGRNEAIKAQIKEFFNLTDSQMQGLFK